MRVYSAHKTAGRFAPKIINKKFRFVLKRGKCGSIFKTNLDIFIIFRETKAFFCEILLSLPLWERGLKYVNLLSEPELLCRSSCGSED